MLKLRVFRPIFSRRFTTSARLAMPSSNSGEGISNQYINPRENAIDQKFAQKSPTWPAKRLQAKGVLECALMGKAILTAPPFNRGAGFTHSERLRFEIDGLLPSAVHTLKEQERRAYEQYSLLPSPLSKNGFLQSMKDQNQVLFYKLLQNHLEEMFSVIYTPTEGEAIEKYSHVFRRPEGCFLNIEQPDKIEELLGRWGTEDEIDYIVVTDGEEILGIGDQGVGGIGISTAKLVLMTLCAGIHPNRTLPVVLDCGTDNEKLLDDELYLGLRKPRVRGKEYDDFVDTFVQAVKRKFPKAYLHFEDFGLTNARRLLDLYRPQLPCFNDDVQGTGAVTLAAIISALWVCKLKLTDMRLLIFGSGSAGTGIADQVRDAMAEMAKISKEEASKKIWLVDKPGILLQSHGDNLTKAQKSYARPDEEFEGVDVKDLQDVIKHVKPHVLIGTSTKPKAFTEGVVKEMAKHVDRPIIFPLSNPTRLHEASPEDINKWTEGKALIATGSPFDPVEWDGKTYVVAECNNSTCFPGIGLGSVLSRASHVSDGMLVAAVHALAELSPALKDPDQGLLPDVSDVRSISAHIAVAVIKKAREEGVTRVEGIPEGDEELSEWVKDQMWDPEYRELRKVEFEGAGREAKGEVGAAGKK